MLCSTYLISTNGRIFSVSRKRLLRFKKSNGFNTLEFTPRNKTNLPSGRDGKLREPQCNGRMTVTVGRLVAETFLVKQKKHSIVIHLDYCRANDDYKNLKWASSTECMHHIQAVPGYKEALKKANKAYKLTTEQVLEMKKILKQKQEGKTGITISEIAKKYGIAEMNVFRIQNGQIWSNVGKVVKKKVVPVKFTPDQVRQIRNLVRIGHVQKDVATLYNTSPTVISRIVNGKYYKNVVN